MKVLVSGSHGMIGSALTTALEESGHTVGRLVRGEDRSAVDVTWSPDAGKIDSASLVGYDAVVHLAGEPIVGRWTTAKRRRILRSRERGTSTLAAALAGLDAPPSALVCASAVGYYGDGGDQLLDERSPRGEGFLADVVERWERAAAPARDAGIRTVHTRAGIVLSPKGGALQRLLLPFRLGLGGRVGSGHQYWAWIGLSELVRLLVRAVEDAELEGVYNAVGPQQTTNREFTKALGSVLHRPTPFPVPAAPMRWAMGDLVDEMLVASQRVVPARLVDAGYDFLDATLEDALEREIRSKHPVAG